MSILRCLLLHHARYGRASNLLLAAQFRSIVVSCIHLITQFWNKEMKNGNNICSFLFGNGEQCRVVAGRDNVRVRFVGSPHAGVLLLPSNSVGFVLSYHPEGRENPVGVVLPRAGQGVVVPHQRVVMLLMQHCISISHWHQNILFIISLMMNRAIKAIICFHVAAPVARCLCIVPFVFGAISIVVFGERANTSRNCNNVQEHLELLAQ